MLKQWVRPIFVDNRGQRSCWLRRCSKNVVRTLQQSTLPLYASATQNWLGL